MDGTDSLEVLCGKIGDVFNTLNTYKLLLHQTHVGGYINCYSRLQKKQVKKCPVDLVSAMRNRHSNDYCNSFEKMSMTHHIV